MNALSAKSEDEIRTELRGFPASAVESVLALRGDFTASRLRAAVLGVLEFYLPKSAARSLAEVPDSARLSEDMGVDSLSLAEAAFKLDELLTVPIETHETAQVKTVGELHTLLCRKLELLPPDAEPA
jgi:acyl carrier protein